ncbi:lymphocyte cytosolic protein 2-like isoform X17 [Bolinopsis microptera]|uniref:lymphocyte cytosolic protein 2-like isoform X17 n=1 Tax=Bolinopsis microptera TaxID=2820187 RepID=UPI0030798D64
MSKRVVDWTSPDVMVWLTKNMNKLTSAESLRVYVQMEAINGETMLGFKKSDCSRFGLIKENDFDKILKKLRSCDEKIEKDLRKNTGRRTKKKPGLFGGDKADSGLDESSSVCEDQGFHREIKVHSDSPGSANTSGTGSFAPSLSGGSSHKGHSGMVAPATYEWEPQPGRTTIPEATYVAPEDIHRIGTFEQVWSPEPEGRVQDSVSFGSEVLVPLVSSVGHYEATIRINDPNVGYLNPDEVEAPTRAVPRMYPTLPEPEPDWDPDALYENFEPPPPPAVDDRVDEWIDDEQLYLNQEVEGDGVETEDIYENQEFDSSSEDGEMEDIYENNEADHSSSEEESSEEEGDNFADISRRLTLAMSVINTVKKESVPVRPPIQPPAAGSFGSSVARRPVEPPAAPVAAKPATPSRDVSSRDVPSGPPAPPSKPKLSSLDQNTSHFLPTTPSPVKGTSGGMSIKEKIALLNSEKSNDYLVQSEKPPTKKPVHDAAASVSIKDRQSKIAGLFGASQPTASLPTPPPPTPSPLGLEKKPPLGGRPLIPHGAPTRNPPVGSLPPRRPTPQLPPPSLGPDLPPPPLPSLSCIPQSNTNLSTGCYEDNEITFPIPSPTKGRFPLPPPSMGYNPPNSGVGGYNPTEEDEEGLYDLEPEGPDDIYNDGDEEIYNDGDDEADKIPGYLPHVSSRGTAEELLRNDPQPECFLVRDSTNNPQQYPYVISLKAVGNTFEHTRLGSRSNGKLAIGTAKSMETTHESLADLIHYHRTTPLNLRGRNVLLKYPITPR